MRHTCLIYVLFCVILLTSCSLIPSNKPKPGSGGVFKSYDRAATWENKSYVIPRRQDDKIVGQTSLTNTSALVMVNDYRDQRLIYLGTTAQGLFRTEDGGDSWRQIITQGYVGGIALDPMATSTIYATVNNQILKSTNYGQNWRVVYTEGRSKVLMSTIAIDPYQPNTLYAGTSWGELLKSHDFGVNWKIVQSCGGHIKKVIVNLNDTNIIYAATWKRGIFRSSDKGETWENTIYNLWTDSNRRMKYKSAVILHDVVLDPGRHDSLLVVTEYGLFKLYDQGKTWQRMAMVTPPKEKKVYSINVDPKDSNYIYYGTSTTINRSEDGGETWASLRLPSPKAVTALLIDKQTPNIIYIGTRALTEEEHRRVN